MADLLADGYSRQLTTEIERVVTLLLAEHGTRDEKTTHAGVCRIFGRLFFNDDRVAQMAAGMEINFAVAVPPPQLTDGTCACVLCDAVGKSAVMIDTWETSDPVQAAARSMLMNSL